MKYGPLVDEFTLCVTCPKWCSAPKKGEKINASTNSAEFFLLRAELKYEKLLPFLVNRGDLLSSGIASEAFSFYNPLKWALLFSRNRSNSGVKKKRKRVGAWPSQLQYFVCLTLLLHLHTVPNIHFLSNKSTWRKPCILWQKDFRIFGRILVKLGALVFDYNWWILEFKLVPK